MNEFVKLYTEKGEVFWVNVRSVLRIEKRERTGYYYALVFDKFLDTYLWYRIGDENDVFRIVGEYSVC